MVTAIRSQGFVGRFFVDFSSSSCYVAPASVVLKRPLPLGAVGLSPPERNVQPLRRKSHMLAKSDFEFSELMDIIPQPVERFVPFRILFQVLPPSLVL